MREVLVHRVRAGEQLAEAVGADGDGDRQADGRPHRIAAADPVPEAEGGRDAELRAPRSTLVVSAAKWRAMSRAAAARSNQARADARVGHRLDAW